MNWNSRGNSGYNDRGGDRGGDRGDKSEQRFPNSGTIFPSKNRRSENSPDFYGDFVISDDVLDYVIREAERGRDVKLELSGWSRMSRNNLNFTSLKVNIPYEVRQQEGGNPTYRSRFDRGREPQRGRSPSYRDQSGRDDPRGRNDDDQRGRYRDDDRGDPRGNRYSQQRDDPPPYRNNPRDQSSLPRGAAQTGDAGTKPGFFDDEIPF
jgi:hypothetical protein